MKLTFEQVVTITWNGKRYILVSDNTAEVMNEVGLGGREICVPVSTFAFMGMFSKDTKEVKNLKNLLPEGDTKPIVFSLAKSIGAIMHHKSRIQGQLFGGNDWTGYIGELKNAWLVYLTNSYR